MESQEGFSMKVIIVGKSHARTRSNTSEPSSDANGDEDGQESKSQDGRHSSESQSATTATTIIATTSDKHKDDLVSAVETEEVAVGNNDVKVVDTHLDVADDHEQMAGNNKPCELCALEGRLLESSSHGRKTADVQTSNKLTEVDKEIAKRNAEAMHETVERLDLGHHGVMGPTMSDYCHRDAFMARTNTPAGTSYTDIIARSAYYRTPGLNSETRDLMFQEAIDLMTERCPSMALVRHDTRTPLVSNSPQPFGVHVPRYFYVNQKKPSRTAPLKAWRGYNGNVYFEPIKVNQANYSAPEYPGPSLDGCSEQMRDILKKSKRIQSSRSLSLVPYEEQNQDTLNPTHPQVRSMTALSGNSATFSKTSAKTSQSTNSIKGARKMAVLDKNTVFDRNNPKIHEDIVWIVGQESTGSLCIDSEAAEKRSRTAKPQTKPLINQKTEKDKICRGSVAHKICRDRGFPFLSVTGDRYSQQQLPSSPLLRTQTQYSQSSQRNINSPDLFSYGGYHDKLPPLEQVRASLRQMDHSNQSSPQHVIPPMERLKFEDARSMTKNKPLVKYSTEVKNSAKLGNRRIPIQSRPRVL